MSTESETTGPDYDLVCPACDKRCVGKTCPRGVRGMHREAYVNYQVRRLICCHCGLVRQSNGDEGLPHRFWFRIEIGGNVLWAENEARLRAIRDVLSDKLNRNDAHLDALPKWLLLKVNRSKAIGEINKMILDPSLREIQDA